MKKNKSHFVLLVVFFMSCVSFRKLDFSKVQLGMTKAEVSQTLKAAPENMIGSKQYKDGIMEVQQYHYINSKDIYYWLYFWNGKLIKYETPELRGKSFTDNGQDSMDKAYESMQPNQK